MAQTANSAQVGARLEEIYGKMSDSMAASGKQLEELAKTIDPNNPADLIKFQKAMAEWSMIGDLNSTILKDFRELCRSIIQKS